MLGRDCLRALFSEPFPPRLKWLNNGFLSMSRDGFKVGNKWVSTLFTHFCTPKPTFYPLWTHFRILTRPYFEPTFSVEIRLFSKKRPWGSRTIFAARSKKWTLRVVEITQSTTERKSHLHTAPPCENFCLLQGSFGPFRPKVAKIVPKRVLGDSQPGAQKVTSTVEKEPNLKNSWFWLVFDSVLDFLDPQGRESPRTLFGTLFATLGPKGPNDPCSRARESQAPPYCASAIMWC